MSVKLAYCIPALYSASGMEKTLTIKANYFADVLGYDVFIIITDGFGKPPAFPLSNNISVINLNIDFEYIWNYPIYKKALYYTFKQLLYKRRLSKTLKQIKPDITISTLRREINFITKIKDGSRKVGELHFNKRNYRDLDIHDSPGLLKSIVSKLWMHQLIGNLKRLDRFVVLSHEDKGQWNELDNISVIYNPLDKLPEKTSDCSAKKVIAAGRFVHVKGYDMLIDSWKIVSEKHPDWTLTIYGAGNKDSFRSQAAVNGIGDKCFFEEPVSNLEDKFVESSIFAFSSRFEGFGMVITEAMASGIPPVAFACPCGPKEIINDGINGLLVEKGNINSLAEKIIYLIENEGIRKEMGLAAKKRAERFQIEVVAKEWESLFKELMS
jgi:glycosyltransferase involved in cell wall biosynthesis